MSPRHPVIAITGSGAGTTTVTTTFQQVFRREGVKAVIVYGDAFHRYDRDDMRTKMAEAQSICPQFSQTHVNFQRVPTVDTRIHSSRATFRARTKACSSFASRIRGASTSPIYYQCCRSSFMSRANTIVCPGSKMPLAMQLIFTPMIWRLMDRKKRAS